MEHKLRPRVVYGIGVFLLGILSVVWIALDVYDVTRTTLVSQTDVIEISDPARMQLWYGTLDALPHTYQFVISETMEFRASIMVPAHEDAAHPISAILIREPQGKGRVTEIARLAGADAQWKEVRLRMVGTTYLQGPVFSEMLEAGTYRLEIHTPDNRESYVLQTGTQEDRTLGYFALLRELAALKTFSGGMTLGLIFTPYVYAPVLIFLELIGCALYIWRRRTEGI